MSVDIETFGTVENYYDYLDQLRADYRRLQEELTVTADLLWMEGIDAEETKK